jgi:parallel beta-helix repeat protein
MAAIAARPAFAVQCGDVIQTDLKLTSNLNCTGTALRVFGPLLGAPNITIDLNGHNITGDGTGMGVFIFDGQVTLKGKGRISNFEAGVSLITARDVEIYDLTIENNLAGIALFRSSQVRIFDNTIRGGANGLSGVIMSVVSHTALYRNTISGFSDVNILEDIQPRNQGIRVEGNRLSRNGTDLLWDGASNSCWLQNVFVTSSPQVLPKCAL